MSVPQAEVTVLAPYQVNHEGAIAGPGETLTVPATVAEAWEVCGFVTVDAGPPRAAAAPVEDEPARPHGVNRLPTTYV